MKKNKMMRLAAWLLVATLLTTSLISGTFAKYVTTAEGTDTARVAKFGVKISEYGNSFKTKYDNEDSATVSSQSNDNVVAPGTKGEMTKINLTGTPEVKVKVTYEGAFSLGENDNWKDKGGNFYCPLVIKVNDTSIQQSDTYNTKDKFVTAVNNAIAAYSKEYAPGTDLSQQGNDSLSVSWEWPFDDESKSGTNDAKDTDLGNATTAPTVTLKVKTTVTQID